VCSILYSQNTLLFGVMSNNFFYLSVTVKGALVIVIVW